MAGLLKKLKVISNTVDNIEDGIRVNNQIIGELQSERMFSVDRNIRYVYSSLHRDVKKSFIALIIEALNESMLLYEKQLSEEFNPLAIADKLQEPK